MIASFRSSCPVTNWCLTPIRKCLFLSRGVSKPGATIKRPALLPGRSVRDLITILDNLKQRGVKFRSLTEPIDTETPTGRAMWQMIGILAELERSLTYYR
jgi:hypothetical protein